MSDVELGGLFGDIIAAVLHKKLKLKNICKSLAICGLYTAIMETALLLNICTCAIYITITFMCFCSMSVATLFTTQIFAMVQSQTHSNIVGKIMVILIEIALFM